MKRYFIATLSVLVIVTSAFAASWKTIDTEDSSINGGEIIMVENEAGAGNNWMSLSTIKTWVLSSFPACDNDQDIWEWDTTTSAFVCVTPTDVTAGAGIDITTGTISVEDAIRTKEVAWTIKDSDVVTAVADGKQAFAVPASMNGMNLVDCTATVADLNSAASGSTTVVLRRLRGATAVDMTSTGVTVAYNEYSASDETVDTANDDLATGDKLYPDVNAVTSAVHKGLSFTCLFRLP